MTQPDLQLEGLVGPTHNYAGLSHGNVASTSNAGSASSPRAAALQSLDKMKFVASLGVPVAIWPPQPRPAFDVLQRLGYSGSEKDMLSRAWAEAPELVANIYSASSMWAANAATVTPSTDTGDGKVHFTPANLISTLHRSIETRTTTDYLRRIFTDEHHFKVHDALPVTTRLADEGAANHMRLCRNSHTDGAHVFVYGSSTSSSLFPASFPARQQRTASETVARMHQISPDHTLYLQQQPDAIDAGVFHNDVIALSHGNFVAYHEKAYVDDSPLQALGGIQCRIIRESELSLADAVTSYFFNAQLVGLHDGGCALILPAECAAHPQARALADALLAENNLITQLHFLDVRESMRNGGGPACLRLRIPLTDLQLASMHQPVRYTAALHEQLGNLITEHYRETIHPSDLADPALATQSRATHARVLSLLGLGDK